MTTPLPDSMPLRARELVARLGLLPHPEGGYYREIFRSPRPVTAAGGTTRSALTVIHFLLPRGAHSALHRVAADEAWHFLEGEPLELVWLADSGGGALQRLRLGGLDAGAEPVAVVPGGAWQACRPLGDHALVACDVAPGFDFADFALLRDTPAERDLLIRRHPELAELL